MWQYVVPASMLALLLVGGCAKTTVMQQQSYEGPRLAKPARILVYDFAAHASDLPAGYATVVAAPPVDQSSDDLSLVQAGKTVAVPGPGYGFDYFRAAPPWARAG